MDQTAEKQYLEAVWEEFWQDGQTINYHNKLSKKMCISLIPKGPNIGINTKL